MMSTRQQLKLIAYVMPAFLSNLAAQPKKKHYAVRAIGTFPHEKARLEQIDL